MLTDQEKDRIKLEESYRFEVRQSVSNKEKKSDLWSFLNSPFALWLFSTVAIGLISWGYQSCKTNLEVRHSQEIKRSSLASEIGFRLQPIEPMRNFDEILIYLNQLDSSDVNRFAINEYKDRTFNSLLWEIENVAPNRSERKGPGLFESFQVIQKTPTKENNNDENLMRFKLFCDRWADYSTNTPSGALTRPSVIIEENGVVKTIAQ